MASEVIERLKARALNFLDRMKNHPKPSLNEERKKNKKHGPLVAPSGFNNGGKIFE